MATKKEMVAELVSLGANEEEIKDLKNAELEEMLEKSKEPAVLVDESEDQGGDKEEGVEEATVEVPSDSDSNDEPDSNDASNDQPTPESKTLRETSQQLGIHKSYIYNVQHVGATVIVENLGYGDAYISIDGLAVVGKSERLSFKEMAKFEGVAKLYFASASQPVIQILEVK